jgi:uracil-DNA glycosylase family 4
MRWCCAGVCAPAPRPRGVAILVAERIDVLQELGLTPLWRLRARSRSDVTSVAPHAVNESPLATLPPAEVGNRVARIAILDRAVPGVGDVRAEWLFVGEAPGAEEDAKGEPFVGQAGRLLDSMLAALGMSRIKAVYIANVLKCRPPGNRAPTPLEVEACLPYLDRQIALIQPKLIVALGKSAATTMLHVEATIASLRGRVHRYRGVPLIVTYHPAYLLRNLPDKAKAWEDLCLARATLRGILQADILQTAKRDPT